MLYSAMHETFGKLNLRAVLGGARRAVRAWPGLKVEYACLPPFEGASLTRPNRLEVVFSAHSAVAVAQEGRVHDVRVVPGGCYVVGPQPTTLLRVGEYSDTLELYPDADVLAAAAERANIRGFALEPTLRDRAVTFAPDPLVLPIGHRFRRACLGVASISDVEASEAAHALAAHVLRNQHRAQWPSAEAPRLRGHALRKLTGYIEERLEHTLTLDALAEVVHMSPFHFARCFKRVTGLAPHQYVLARRIDLARRRLLTTSLPVRDVAWSIGFENLSHFRRQFRAQLGLTPGDLRKAVGPARATT